MQYYNANEILNQNEYLLAQLREYLGQRFDTMDREMILKFCIFLKDLGMFFNDEDMILRLQDYFVQNYYLFELPELF